MKVHDPVAMERFKKEFGGLDVIVCTSAEQVIADSDAVVLVTEWNEYRELPWESLAARMRSPIVLDGRNALDRAALRKWGYRYIGLPD